MTDTKNVTSWTVCHWENNAEECAQLLKDETVWNQVPSINGCPSHHFVDGQIVRFRGMIQDMHNPEFYMASYEVHNSVTGTSYTTSGKFKDIVICELNEEIKFDSKNNHGERQSFYCITVPALNQWAQESVNKLSPERVGSITREMEESKGVKRRVEEDMEVEEGTTLTKQDSEPSPQRIKVEKGNSHESASSGTEGAHGLNFPIPGSVGQACILKVYDTNEKIVLNEEIEVIGFLSLDPNLSCLTTEDGEENMEEQRTLHPPPSLVPRLHVIAIQRMAHSLPLLSKFNFQTEVQQALQEGADALQHLRTVFTHILLGDRLATDFMVCHLISKIFLRKDVTTLGHLSINFYNIPAEPEDYTVQMSNILQQLLPKSHYLPLTLSDLNTIPFIPKKDYKSDQLKSGLLQLSNGTHLIIDETKLSTGQLGDLGTRNMLALQTLIAKHKVDYDFQFYQIEVPADIPILVFSEKKSLLSTDIQLPMCIDPDKLRILCELFDTVNNFLKRETVIDCIRKFLCAARIAEYSIPDSVQEQVQEDFVDMRQQNPKMTGDDLHSMLVLARALNANLNKILAKLLTLSKGQQSLTVEIWKEARCMEEERRARLEK